MLYGNNSRISVITIGTLAMKLTQNESQVSDESDDYLLELIGLKEDFPNEAMKAYGKLYARYWNLMFVIAKDKTKDEDTACDLVADTFNMIFNKASTFKKGKVRNPGNVSLSVKKWMTTIMERIFYDHFLDDAYKEASQDEEITESYIVEKKYLGKIINDDYDGFVNELELSEENNVPNKEITLNDAGDSKNLSKVKDYIEKLGERERDIILAVYSYYAPNKYTPTVVLDDLANRWGTTKQNIRKILEKFRKAITEELQPQMLIRK